MKTLFVIRHAKSSWDEPGLSDLERPLNDRGLRDAPFMAKMLRGKGIPVDKLISSPAKRAHDTASFFAGEWKIHTSSVGVERAIYEASPAGLLDLVHAFSNDWETVFLFGHNPTLTSFVNFFSREYLVNLPTCGIVHLVSEAEKWDQFGVTTARVAALYYPRQFFPK